MAFCKEQMMRLQDIAVENEDPIGEHCKKRQLANAPKIRFFIDINGARNEALMYGKKEVIDIGFRRCARYSSHIAKQYLEDFTQNRVLCLT